MIIQKLDNVIEMQAHHEARDGFIALARQLSRQYRDATLNTDGISASLKFAQPTCIEFDIEPYGLMVSSDKTPPQYNDGRRFVEFAMGAPA